MEPVTFRSAVKRSTDWANPAVVEEQCKHCPELAIHTFWVL